MIYPTRKIREVDSFTKNYDYWDDEKVTQEDGRIALFFMSNHSQDKGWQFDHYVDSYNFMIWEESHHNLMWDNNITTEQLLLKSIIPHTPDDMKYELGQDFKIGENEQISKYRYGGVLSSRWGWFITSKDNPNKILRSKQTTLS